jgi:glycine/D-amino acid oxidase-like deaminating enzyme
MVASCACGTKEIYASHAGVSPPVRVGNAGPYEQSEPDGNPSIGPTGFANLHTIAGFSSHGMMDSPAAARAIAELILKGHFESIDLTRMGHSRVKRGEPYCEAGIL